jgi:cysteinyl-tRNA synthetase
MNITDVGHLTGDNLGDADTGEDRLEKGAKKEGKTAWEVAQFYADDFKVGLKKMNFQIPKLVKATDHIQEQIELVKRIEDKGFAYEISDGIYFDVQAYERAGHNYGELSNIDEVKEGARVEKNEEKRGERDFALWKFSPKDKQRDMEWDSFWGKGFPGWHIECSAMSMKYLGEQFDIHIGGEDLLSTHHPNEIAQAESATDKQPFVKYWVHGRFLLVDGGRMGKSLGNAYNLQDIEDKGFDPLALRYFYLMGHYRKQQNFTWEALEGASKALERLKRWVADARVGLVPAQERATTGIAPTMGSDWPQKFVERISDDLDLPGALAVVWKMVKDDGLSENEKLNLVLDWDQVLGLGLDQVSKLSSFAEAMEDKQVSSEVQQLLDQREQARKDKNWSEADEIREQIEKLGFMVEDQPEGPVVKKK